MSAERPPFAVEPEVMAVLEILWRNGHAAYLVGGAVRDALLGLPGSDWDVATDARPERIVQLFPGATYENRFGTVLARGLEITTFRRDHHYADHRRPDSVTFSDDVYEDLARRDLTINAIAWGSRDLVTPARLVDPADGQGDLRARLVRAVGDPSRRFEEDALRLLRAVRIAARLRFTIEPVTRAAMEAHAADVAWVSEERVGAEVRDMLAIDQPSRAFRLLLQTGILAGVLPELGTGPPPGEGHPWSPERDAFERTLGTLDAVAELAPGQVRLAWAALLAEVQPDAARACLARLRVGGQDRDAIVRLIAASHVEAVATQSDADVRRFMSALPPELLDDLLLLRQARASVRGGTFTELEAGLRTRILAQREAGVALSLDALAIDGHDLQAAMGIPEGPLIGRILERLLADVIEDPSLNRRGTLLTRAGLMLDAHMQGRAGGSHAARME
jgi:tRNA nucleotidyltransferase/poly(A) polymerase